VLSFDGQEHKEVERKLEGAEAARLKDDDEEDED
jgi:hypothetical protein